MSEIKFQNVSIYYQNRKEIVTAVDDISFSFHDKKINVLVGFSGCGKSSILNAITGQILFDGEIYLNDTNIKDIAVQKRNISYVNQQIVLYPHLTVYDNIAYPLKLLKYPRDQIDNRVKELATKLEIDFLLTRKPKFLSIGQQQRVAIARAFAKKPEIVLMDEPLSNLDKQTSEEIRHYIKSLLKETNATCVYVSHNITDAVSLADSIFVMNEGKIIGEYSPIDFLKTDNEIVSKLRIDLPNETESK
jgi:ABC-type sugar transport system ATPase subunit